MTQHRIASVAKLLEILQSGDPVPAGVLTEKLGFTRPVVARLVAEAGKQVIRIGRARATSYVATSPSLPNQWPLYRVKPDASLQVVGTLHALRGDKFLLVTEGVEPNLMRAVESVPGHFPGIPWFLDDTRPQGFLGRAMAHRIASLVGVPQDLKSWQPRHNLIGILHGGTNIGNLLLGEAAAQRAQSETESPTDSVHAGSRPNVYMERATEALAGEQVGSSPGGEQPKFTATVCDNDMRYAALVKFALPGTGAAGARWADLLTCEHLALMALRNAGFAAAKSQLIRTETHTFLEVERFDRTRDQLGRRGFVSLLAVDAAFIGGGTRDWGTLADDLVDLKLISRKTADDMAKLHWFGKFIGNSDMHLGNVALELVEEGLMPLCPAYDMLPMYLAPSSTGMVRDAVPISLSVPGRPGLQGHIDWAAAAATDFWKAVSAADVSSEIRQVASKNLVVIDQYRHHWL